jgi:hypothetical protein
MANQFGRSKKKKVERVEVYSLLDPGTSLEPLDKIYGNAGTDVTTTSFRHLGQQSSITWEAPNQLLIRKHLEPAGCPPTIVKRMATQERMAREKRQRERERKEREERRRKREEQRKHGKHGKKGAEYTHSNSKKGAEASETALPSFAAYRQQQEKKQQIEEERQEAKRKRQQRAEEKRAAAAIGGQAATIGTGRSLTQMGGGSAASFSQSTPVGLDLRETQPASLEIGRVSSLQAIKDRFYNPDDSLSALDASMIKAGAHNSTNPMKHHREESASFRIGSATRAVIYYEGLPCPIPNGEPMSLASIDPYGFSVTDRPEVDLQLRVLDHWPAQQRAYPALKGLMKRKLRQYKCDKHINTYTEQTHAVMAIQGLARSWLAQRHMRVMLTMRMDHESKIRASVVHMVRRSEKRCFAAWASYAHRIQKAKRMLHKVQQGDLQHRLQHWAARTKREKSERQAKVIAASTKLLFRETCAAFRSWAEYAERNARAKKFLKKHYGQTKVRVLHQWRDGVEEKKRVRKLLVAAMEVAMDELIELAVLDGCTAVEEEEVDKLAAIEKIQATRRGLVVRRQQKKEKMATEKCQKMYRGHQGREKVKRTKRVKKERKKRRNLRAEREQLIAKEDGRMQAEIASLRERNDAVTMQTAKELRAWIFMNESKRIYKREKKKAKMTGERAGQGTVKDRAKKQTYGVTTTRAVEARREEYRRERPRVVELHKQIKGSKGGEAGGDDDNDNVVRRLEREWEREMAQLLKEARLLEEDFDADAIMKGRA